jgi:ATP-dependent Clp protease adaptor protein ClpS
MNFTNNVQLLEMSKKQFKTKRGQWQVMLHDDDINTFDHVISCLVEVCGHNYYQAVQCATIVHNNGICSIFVDSYDECESVYEELFQNGISVSIIKYKKL